MERKKKGFTLAELLIVVAIIAVLVAISIPVFSNQLEKARRAVDLENARNIRSVLANGINNGDIVFNNKDATVFVFVTKDTRNGGTIGEVAGVYDGIKINGTQYKAPAGYNGKDYGQALMWKYLTSNGVASNLLMKQKSPDTKWYGVSIDGYGKSYYYEGTVDLGKTGYVDSARKYDWSDINTPISKLEI